MALMNIEMLVREFYAIEAVSAMLKCEQYSCFQPMRHSHNRWCFDFTEFQESFINKFASAIYDYTALVVAGEMRHGKWKASHYIRDYYTNSSCREDVYQDCSCYRACDILLAGLRLFDPKRVNWDDSFGGEKWYHIAKAGLLRGMVSDEVFIDHCVDLSHNNSIYFDKSAGIFYLHRQRDYEEFLDFKRICEPQDLVKGQFGYHLNRLLLRANHLGILQDCEPTEPIPSLITENEDTLLAYQPVYWGSATLSYSEEAILKNDSFGISQRRERRHCDDYRLAKCA